jgi:Xaa-Pro aminopeptidase
MNETVYKQRRDRLLEMMNDGVAVLATARQQTRSNDTEHPFRQESNFYYLCGFEEDNSALVFVKSGDVARVLLFVQPKDETMELWTGKRTGVDAAKERFDVDDVHSIDAFENVVSTTTTTNGSTLISSATIRSMTWSKNSAATWYMTAAALCRREPLSISPR